MVDQAPAELSARETEILQAVATGATNQQVAVDLSISINTVKAHLRNIYAKLEVESRTEATLYAIQHGLIVVDAFEVEPEQAADGVEDGVAVLLHPPVLSWPVNWTQSIVGLLVLVSAFVLALWPTQAAMPIVGMSQLADAPTSHRLELPSESLPRWSGRASIGAPRARFALAQVNEVLYVIGGTGDDGWSDAVDAYHVGDDVWQSMASKPTAVANIGAAVVDGLIYVPGGSDATGVVKSELAIYDPVADHWQTGVPMIEPICAYGIAGIDSGFCIVGGWDGTSYVDGIWVYDATAAEWVRAGQLPQPMGFLCAQAVDDRIYVTGGSDGEAEYAMCASFALDAQHRVIDWVDHAPMSQARAGHGMALLEDSLYIVGGGWGEPFRLNERYDVFNDVWSTFNSPIVGEWRNLGLAAVDTKKGGSIIAIGGFSGGYLSVMQAYQAVFRVFIPS